MLSLLLLYEAAKQSAERFCLRLSLVLFIYRLTVCLGDVIHMIFHSTCGFLLLDSSAWIFLLQHNSKGKLIQLENVLNKTNYELIFQDNTGSDWP